MKQTEPIGFKGTPGKWVATDLASMTPVIQIDADRKDLYRVCDIPTVGFMKTGHADAELICASKNMAIALQNNHDCMIAIHTVLGGGVFDTEELRQILRDHMTKTLEALKQAGL